MVPRPALRPVQPSPIPRLPRCAGTTRTWRAGRVDSTTTIWPEQSGASEWSVAQVLSHLGSGAEIALAGLQAAAAGTDRPGQDFNLGVWDRWNAMTPRQQADGFLTANEALVSAYENLDDTARRDLRIDLGFLPFPADLALVTGMRLNEATLHGWDVRVAFDPDAGLPAAEAAIALDLLTGPLSFLLGFQAKTQILDGRKVTVRVVTTDPDRVVGLLLADKAELGAGYGGRRRRADRPGRSVPAAAGRPARRGAHTSQRGADR